ncbi:acyltransferase [Candidatus Contendibacter odensensis]|uniref:Acetyltransferase protein n=1 Tax=Candidatus Contendobacter odensis Run_B_J11 TaxID=1400861 RepID=A0A7U7J5V6_9GAMM|nr:acyltransferase [Candidatus Contendobacter odensis]CDH47287.1 putative acetyltransferase protein [Candidatus Contendobacter odensis Run_B_J11]
MHIISNLARISHLADLEDSIKGSQLIVEDEVSIDSFVKIKFTGGLGDVRIGRGTVINSGVVIYSGNGVNIGEDVAIAANCTFAAVNHEFQRKDVTIKMQRFQPSRGGILIENDVWIGANCVILDGAIIHQGCVVGAGSLVRSELAPYSINIGNPLRRIGWRR